MKTALAVGAGGLLRSTQVVAVLCTEGPSGQASVGVAGAGGRGTIDDGALEQSNVNISTEFSNLIVAQRAFEANSKTVTTFDSLTQATLGMVR